MSLISRSKLLLVPPYVCGCVNILFSTYISDKFKYRGLVNAFNLCFAIIGFIVLDVTETSGAQYAGACVAASGALPSIPLTIAWNANNIQNSATKRAVGIALQTSIGSFGAIIAAYRYSSF